MTFSCVHHNLDSLTATMEQNGFDPLKHSVLLLATLPHGQVPEVRGLQEDTLGGQMPYQHKGLNAKSRRENANNGCADV